MKVQLRLLAVLAALLLLTGVALSADESTKVEKAPDKPVALSGAGVSMPWADFKTFLDKLNAQGATPEPEPPYEALLGNADYTANVGEDGVEVTIEVDAFVLKSKGWAAVALMTGGTPIAEATLDGKPASLATGDDGMVRLIAQGSGHHALKLRLSLPLSKDGGPEQFALPAIRGLVNRLEVKLPRPDLQVNLSPAGFVESRTTGGATIATGSFPPGDRVVVSWARQAPKVEKEEARISAEVRTTLTVGEGLAVYTAIVDYDIKHKSVSQFSLALPADVTVADVTTLGLADWKATPGPDGQQLDVSISFEATGRHQISVTYEKTLPAEATTVVKASSLDVRDVVREIGYLAVAVRTNIQVTPKDGSLQNLTAIDPTELPPDLRGVGDLKVIYGFKYIKLPSGLELEVVKHKDASVLTCEVEQASYRVLLTDRGKQLIEGTFRIANRSLQYLTLTLPKDTDLWGVFRDGEPVKAAEADGKVLLPVFQSGLRQAFTLKILAFRKTGGLWPVGYRTIALPAMSVGANKVQLELFAPPAFRLFGFGGKLRAGSFDDSRVPTVSSLDGKKGGDAGEATGREMDKPVDQLRLDSNLAYRDERAQVQTQTANIPLSLSNAAYETSMARGVLPVHFDVSWEGRRYAFQTSLVDPNEKTGVSFAYSRNFRSGKAYLLILALAIVFGYAAAVWLLARRSSLIAAPSGKLLKIGGGAAIAAVVLAEFVGYSLSTPIFGAVIGATLAGLRWLLAWDKTRPKTPKPPKPLQPPKTPPAPPPPPAEPPAAEPLAPPAAGSAEGKPEGGAQ